MVNRAWVFACAFGVSLVLGAVGGGCYGGECDCPVTPDRPFPQPPLPISEANNYDDGSLAINPRGGTLEIKRDAVVVRYEEMGVTHEVVYQVTGSAW
jgi:hypothetical protein